MLDSDAQSLFQCLRCPESIRGMEPEILILVVQYLTCAVSAQDS